MVETLLLLGAVFLFICILASKISSRLGVPALLLFVGIGMLAGSEGPGGIAFDDFYLAKQLGLVLLAYVLFSGGLDTDWEEIKPVAKTGISLATLGVLATAALVGAFAHLVLGFGLLEGLLLGSIVSSTDAAAIFGVLRLRGMTIKNRMGPLLEFESGTNDPMAVVLTLGMVEIVKDPNRSFIDLLFRLLQQMPLGLAIGFAFGVGAVWLINHLRLEYDGLYNVITLALVAATYGAAHALGGSEFLAVYIAGLTMASRNFIHKISLIQFHDGLAWLFQITVFLALGLLVFPSQLLPMVGAGTAIAAFLILFARPVAVFVATAFAPMDTRSRLFVSWAGLRGGFPIILGTFPILAGIEGGHLIFNIVFFVVLLSVLVQGSTLRPFGKALGSIVESVPEELQPAEHGDLLELSLGPESPASGKQVVELGLPRTALLVLLKRKGRSYVPRGGTILQPGDVLLVATRKEDHEELRTRLEGIHETTS